jgi:hypothetical protein
MLLHVIVLTESTGKEANSDQSKGISEQELYHMRLGLAQRLCITSTAMVLCQNGLSKSTNFTSSERNISHSVTWKEDIKLTSQKSSAALFPRTYVIR